MEKMQNVFTHLDTHLSENADIYPPAKNSWTPKTKSGDVTLTTRGLAFISSGLQP